MTPRSIPRRGWLRSLPAASCLLACAIVSGCAVPPAEPPGFDLVADAEHAIVRLAQPTLEFADPRSREAMRSGWHRDILPAIQRPDVEGVWGIGDRSVLELYIPEPKDRQLELVALHFIRAGTTIRLRLDGHDLGTVQLHTTLHRHTVPLPASVQRSGIQLLEIEQPDALDTLQPHKDVRTFWTEIHLSGMPPAPRLDVDLDAGLLKMARGTRVDYYLDLSAGSAWALDRVVTLRDAQVRASWHPLDGDAREIATLGHKSETRIPIDGEGPGRLSLETLGVDDGLVTLVRPRLIGVEPKTVPTGDSTASATASAPAVSADGAPPPIILYMIDTLRADHLGVYGYERETSPNIDRFAAESVVFENAFAQSSWTRSSIASALTGLLPPAHGAVDETDMLPEAVVTLAEDLSAAGYRSGAAVANGNASAEVGFGQGFDGFDYIIHTHDGYLSRSQTVHERALEWVDQQPEDVPLFLWTLTIDPHSPYVAPEPFHSRFSDRPFDPEAGAVLRLANLAQQQEAIPQDVVDHLRDLYDAEIAHNDATFGDFLDELRQRDLYDRSLIILVADHGEEFYDHQGFEHGRTLYAEQLRTPLIVKLPGSSIVGRRRQPVQQVDLLPTVLELAGISPEASAGASADGRRLHGRSLVPLITDETVDGSWSRLLVKHLDLRQHKKIAATDGRYRVIVSRRHGHDQFPALYDALADPAEQHDLAAERPELARYLVARMRRQLAQVEPIERQQVDYDLFEETREQLRALGYLDD